MIDISKTAICAVIGLGIAAGAQAEQRVPADENKAYTVNISRNGISRVAIDGARIAEIKWLDGDIEIDQDAATGQVFVRALTRKTSSVFVISENGHTYQLLMVPKAKNGDSIIIDYAAKINAQAKAQTASTPKTPQPKAVSHGVAEYVRAIKQFMTAMMSGTAADQGYSQEARYETVPLWQNTLFVKNKQYTAADMTGSVYSLSNTGTETLVIKEQEFYKPGVLAVSARKQILYPGEMTEVFVINKLVN